MRKPTKIAVVVLAIVTIAFLVWPLATKILHMKSEYVTASVIQDVHAFVKKTDGQWPRSWEDLGSENLSSHTHVQFDLDPATATRDQVMTAITPTTGRYQTYPHANDLLNALFEEVVRSREAVQP